MRIRTSSEQQSTTISTISLLYMWMELFSDISCHIKKRQTEETCAEEKYDKQYRKRSCGIKLKEVKENFMSFQRQVPASPFYVCICSLRLSRLIGFLWVSITARTAHHLSHVSWNPSHLLLSFPLNSLDYVLLCSSLLLSSSRPVQ